MKQYPLNEKALLDDLGGLLRIDATLGSCGEVSDKMPLGKGIYDSLVWMMERGESFGFRTKMLDGYACWIECGEGDDMIAALVHVDTVPIEEDGWKAPPFDATVIDGEVYGRGSCDDKGPALLSLYAMKALADSGDIGGKRIRLIVGGDEESGVWSCMKRYKQTEELPARAFSPDGAYPATYAEKGILHVSISRRFDEACPPIEVEAGSAWNVVPAFASATIDGVRYEGEGKAAHASMPDQGVNALRELCAAMKSGGVSHPFVDMILAFCDSGWQNRIKDEPSGPLTINPAIVEIKDGVITMNCDMRVPVTVEKERVIDAANEVIAPFGFRAEAGHFVAPLYVEKDSALVQTLQRVYAECTGRDDPPVSSGGGSYARAFENAVAFGPQLPGTEETIHKTNERWPLDSMRTTWHVLCNVLREL